MDRLVVHGEDTVEGELPSVGLLEGASRELYTRFENDVKVPEKKVTASYGMIILSVKRTAEGFKKLVEIVITI
eukprot:13096895-Ditylum_brightwellii.AAC.1